MDLETEAPVEDLEAVEEAEDDLGDGGLSRIANCPTATTR